MAETKLFVVRFRNGAVMRDPAKQRTCHRRVAKCLGRSAKVGLVVIITRVRSQSFDFGWRNSTLPDGLKGKQPSSSGITRLTCIGPTVMRPDLSVAFPSRQR